MSPIFKTLGIEQLDFDQRLELVEEIWDSIHEEAGRRLAVPASHMQELERRLALQQAAPDHAEPWEAVKARILAKRKSGA